ncbi:hypothetical protein ACM01_16005 [Streptomyces viridochromogenes]|uniref:Uncharacterized protein n=1 Tax=Streptomyces viridochromogenes TaxID=1938 RepID=A0A0J7ZE50_STRVR|nr:hypothetical protein [Streptomyces viridochromogenes]KMS74114.1 hypothetical protein ACM01_16005 [Streptomyces viridochromogenes]
MFDIDRATETALGTTRDRYGRTVHYEADAAARACRDKAAVRAYATYIAPHADELLDTARRTLDRLPPARHTLAWRTLLDGLATSHTEIRRALDRPAAPGSTAEREQHAALWPHLAFWAAHSYIATELATEHHGRPRALRGEEQREWTQRAQAAKRRGDLDLIESWYAVDGTLMTLAFLCEDDTETVIAVSGDPDGPAWQVIGHYRDDYTAREQLPSPVTPGVLRTDVNRFDRPQPAPEVPLQELIRDVAEAQGASDVSEALLTATRHGYDAGPLVRLQELLGTAGQFAHALETVRGQQIAARLVTLGRHLDFLIREVNEVAEDLDATVAVLPPHRTPQPQWMRPRPALDTTLPTPPPQRAASSPTR